MHLFVLNGYVALGHPRVLNDCDERRQGTKGNVVTLTSHFGIAGYQQEALGLLSNYASLAGKRVLEVGGSNLPKALTHGELGAREWVSVDIIGQGAYQLEQQSDHYATIGISQLADAASKIGASSYVILDGAIENAINLPEGYFDAVLSITSFEHILAVPAAMKAIKRAKTRNAPFFTYHGPIWSGPSGHHVWVDSQINFNNDTWLQPHDHLLCTPPEMYSLLVRRLGEAKAQMVTLQMYHEPRINRLFFEDYEEYFRSTLQDVEIGTYFDNPIPDARQARLEKLYPRYSRFSPYGMTVFGR